MAASHTFIEKDKKTGEELLSIPDMGIVLVLISTLKKKQLPAGL
jgi:hypothetical protein